MKCGSIPCTRPPQRHLGFHWAPRTSPVTRLALARDTRRALQPQGRPRPTKSCKLPSFATWRLWRSGLRLQASARLRRGRSALPVHTAPPRPQSVGSGTWCEPARQSRGNPGRARPPGPAPRAWRRAPRGPERPPPGPHRRTGTSSAAAPPRGACTRRPRPAARAPCAPGRPCSARSPPPGPPSRAPPAPPPRRAPPPPPPGPPPCSRRFSLIRRRFSRNGGRAACPGGRALEGRG